MHRFTLTSNKYPGIQIRVPDLPGTPEKPTPQIGVSGMVTWHRDQSYIVTDATKTALEEAFDTFPERVTRHYRLTWVYLEPDSNTPPVELLPPASPDPEIAPDSNTPPVELSSEDQDLVNIEVAKLLDKTIAEATPVLTATAQNEQIERGLRVAYLNAVMAHEEIQKGLKEEAEDLLKAI